MEESDKNLVSSLENLLSIARDGEKGYQKAAENAKDEDLRTVFMRYANQRSGYVQELQSLISSLGGDADQDSGVAGALHRTWIDIKESLSGHDRHALLSSCESGEDAAKEAYTEFFGDNFEYRGGGSTRGLYTTTGGSNHTYESTGMDTANGSDTSSEGFSNTSTGDRRADSNYSSTTDPEYTTGGSSTGHSTTMSDMDMDSSTGDQSDRNPSTNDTDRSNYTADRLNKMGSGNEAGYGRSENNTDDFENFERNDSDSRNSSLRTGADSDFKRSDSSNSDYNRDKLSGSNSGFGTDRSASDSLNLSSDNTDLNGSGDDYDRTNLRDSDTDYDRSGMSEARSDSESAISNKIYSTVKKQLEGIKEAHDTIKSLRDQAK